MFRLLVLFVVFPGTLIAQDVTLTPEQFDTYSQGKTMFFAQQGRAYGVEQYLKDHKTIWSFADGICVRGTWFAAKGSICFTYENNPDPQCWTFHKDGARYSARAAGADPADDLVVIHKNDTPISCKGPDVGV